MELRLRRNIVVFRDANDNGPEPAPLLQTAGVGSLQFEIPVRRLCLKHACRQCEIQAGTERTASHNSPQVAPAILSDSLFPDEVALALQPRPEKGVWRAEPTRTLLHGGEQKQDRLSNETNAQVPEPEVLDTPPFEARATDLYAGPQESSPAGDHAVAEDRGGSHAMERNRKAPVRTHGTAAISAPQSDAPRRPRSPCCRREAAGAAYVHRWPAPCSAARRFPGGRGVTDGGRGTQTTTPAACRAHHARLLSTAASRGSFCRPDRNSRVPRCGCSFHCRCNGRKSCLLAAARGRPRAAQPSGSSRPWRAALRWEREPAEAARCCPSPTRRYSDWSSISKASSPAAANRDPSRFRAPCRTVVPEAAFCR